MGNGLETTTTTALVISTEISHFIWLEEIKINLDAPDFAEHQRKKVSGTDSMKSYDKANLSDYPVAVLKWKEWMRQKD